MLTTRTFAVLGASAALAAGAGLAAPATASAATHYTHFANCTALHVKYRHGVGRTGARDHVRGSTRPVTTFYRNTGLYLANQGLDRDHDGIACEKL